MSVANMGNARRKRGRRETTHAPAGPSLRTFITSWQLSLEAAGKSPRTVRSYTDSVRALCVFLDAQGMPSDVEGVAADHLRAFLLAEERRTSAPSAAVHFRNLRMFFGWLVREDERTAPSPVDRVGKPKVAKKAKAFFEDDELARLLKACQGSTFEDRRDTAMIRIFMDTGMRVSGLSNLRFDPDEDGHNDLFLTQRRLRVRLKGGDDLGADRQEVRCRLRPVHPRPCPPPARLLAVALARPEGPRRGPHDRQRARALRTAACNRCIGSRH